MQDLDRRVRIAERLNTQRELQKLSLSKPRDRSTKFA